MPDRMFPQCLQQGRLLESTSSISNFEYFRCDAPGDSHWDWLNVQPGGASVALGKLVDAARRTSGGRDRVRAAQESTYWFISAIAGNLPGLEEATRALFA